MAPKLKKLERKLISEAPFSFDPQIQKNEFSLKKNKKLTKNDFYNNLYFRQSLNSPKNEKEKIIKQLNALSKHKKKNSFFFKKYK